MLPLSVIFPLLEDSGLLLGPWRAHPLTPAGGFELALSSTEDRGRAPVDYSVRLGVEGIESGVDHPLLGVQVRRWLESRSAWPGSWQRATPALWLEYDRTQSATPNIFFQLEDPHSQVPKYGREVAACCEESVALVHAGVEILQGVRRVFPSVEEILSTAPPSSRVSFVGCMLARSEPGLRLTIKGIRPQAIPTWVRAMKVPVAKEELAPWVRFLGRLANRVVLHLDVSEEGIHGSLASEIHERDLLPSVSLSDVLQELLGLEQCEEERAAQVLRWPRRVHAVNNSAWPRRLGPASNDFCRQINHIKIDLQFRSKAYLAFVLGKSFPAVEIW